MFNLIPLPWQIAIAVGIFVFGMGAGWQGRTIYQGYLDNRDAQAVIAENEKIKGERITAGVEAGRTLNELDSEGRAIENEARTLQGLDDPSCVYGPDATRLLNDSRRPSR